jgi:predicted nuclease of predicted toxin-antitoxin system
MKLLANENIPLASSELLTQLGYDIVHIGVVNPSISDEEVMDFAIDQERVIITFDRDYGDLVFRKGYRPPGVIYLRIFDFSPVFPGEFIHQLISSGNISFTGKFTVAGEENIRQRNIE